MRFPYYCNHVVCNMYMYEWSMTDFKRSQESVTKGVAYSCAVGVGDPASEHKRTIVCGNDLLIKEFNDPLVFNKEIGYVV